MKLLSNKAIVIGLEPVDLKEYPDLKVLGVNCTGLDHLDWEEINQRSIKVISLKDFPLFMSTITSTAEHTFGLILALLRKYRKALNAPYQEREEYKGRILSDKILGIIGFGRVGKQVKKIAVGFSMAVITHEHGERYLDNLLEESDIVTLHIPLEGNQGFFTKDMFLKMKPGAYLINTSRSDVIEKGALLWALQNKMIAGAAMDFIDDLELVEYSKTHDNLVLTNHIGGCTEEDMERTEAFIINQVENYIKDEN